jgi:hypothetical protein
MSADKSAADDAPYKVGDVVEVEWHGFWFAADVLAVRKNKLRVHYRGWGDHWDEDVTLNRVRRGDPEELQKKTSPAPVNLGRSFGQAPLRIGSPDGSVRPVSATTALKPGDRVQGEWAGAWWAAEVLAVQPNGDVRVHYEGWDSAWDETVPRSRLRVNVPPLWEGREGKPICIHLDGGVAIEGVLLEAGPDHFLLHRQEDGVRLIVNRARFLYCEVED